MDPQVIELLDSIRESTLSSVEVSQIIREATDKLTLKRHVPPPSVSFIQDFFESKNKIWTWDNTKNYLSIIISLLIFFDCFNTRLLTIISVAPNILEAVVKVSKHPTYDNVIRYITAIVTVIAKSKTIYKIKKEGRSLRKSKRKSKRKCF